MEVLATQGVSHVRRSIICWLVLGLVWAGTVEVAARQQTLTVVPSGATSDDDLAALFPRSIDGQPVVVEAWDGGGWIARLEADDPAEAAAMASAESLSTATGTALGAIEVAKASVELDPDVTLTIAAMRVPGSRAYEILDLAVGSLVPGLTASTVGWGWAGDAWISFHVRDEDDGRRLVIAYPTADTVWTIEARTEADVPAGELAEPIVAALPPQTGLIGPVAPPLQRVEIPELGIAVSFPQGWSVDYVPVTDETQQVIDRSTRRSGIKADWKGTLRAVGPVEEGLREGPMCSLIVFEQADRSPWAWVETVTEGNRCYLVDEAPSGLVRARVQPSDCGREWAPSQGGAEHFVQGHDGDIAYLDCWSLEPPGERGSAIAASIEFLPE